MNRTRTFRTLLLLSVALVLAVLIVAVVAMPGTAVSGPTVSPTATLRPQPHPKSHIRTTVTVTPGDQTP